jgi:streptomycin 6-kinase
MNTFEKNITSIYREKGKAWLSELPKLVQECALLWGLSNLTPFSNLSYNYVLSGYKEAVPIVLKLSLNAFDLNKETRALEAFSGYGSVSVLAYKEGALLLQRAVPGHLLKGSGTIQIACKVIKKLHQAPLPTLGNFPHIEEWLTALDKAWKLPELHLQRARRLKKQLLEPTRVPVLLHGDLHRENILSNGEDWLVIDPKGVIGYPINEVWACVEDPPHDLAYIAKYYNFKLDEVIKWYYVHLILAACWQVEDNLDPKHFLDLAQGVLPMMKGGTS